MNNTYSQGESSRVGIGADRAASVDVDVGDTIRCMRGVVWLTQENDSYDYTLVPGVTFCVSRKGRAVLGAIGDPAIVSVTHRDPAARPCAQPGTIRIDSVASFARGAKQARADYVSGLFAKIARAVAQWVRRVTQTRSAVRFSR